MIPNKKEILEALLKTGRAYLFPQGKEKSLEWEICKIYKGDCEACIWSIYKEHDYLFPCEQRPLPPLNPNVATAAQFRSRYVLNVRVRRVLKDMHASQIRYKKDLFKTLVKKTVKDVYKQSKKVTPAFSK